MAGRGDFLFEGGSDWAAAIPDGLLSKPPAGREPRAAPLRLDGRDVCRCGARVLDGQRSSEVKMTERTRGNQSVAVIPSIKLFSFSFSLTCSLHSLDISSQLCATSPLRKVPGRCCSPSTHQPCWWTFCHRAGLPSRAKVDWHQPGTQAWRRPARPSSTSLLQSQKESGNWFTHLKSANKFLFLTNKTPNVMTRILPFMLTAVYNCMHSCFLEWTHVSERWRPF